MAVCVLLSAIFATVALAIRVDLTTVAVLGLGRVLGFRTVILALGRLLHSLGGGVEPALCAPTADIALFTLLELLGDAVGHRAPLRSRCMHLSHLLQLRLQLLHVLFLLDFGLSEGLNALP